MWLVISVWRVKTSSQNEIRQVNFNFRCCLSVIFLFFFDKKKVKGQLVESVRGLITTKKLLFPIYLYWRRPSIYFSLSLCVHYRVWCVVCLFRATDKQTKNIFKLSGFVSSLITRMLLFVTARTLIPSKSKKKAIVIYFWNLLWIACAVMC